MNCTFSLLRTSWCSIAEWLEYFISETRLPEIELNCYFPIISCPVHSSYLLHSWRPWSMLGWIVDMFERGRSVEILVKLQHSLDWEIWNSFGLSSGSRHWRWLLLLMPHPLRGFGQVIICSELCYYTSRQKGWKLFLGSPLICCFDIIYSCRILFIDVPY